MLLLFLNLMLNVLLNFILHIGSTSFFFPCIASPYIL